MWTWPSLAAERAAASWALSPCLLPACLPFLLPRTGLARSLILATSFSFSFLIFALFFEEQTYTQRERERENRRTRWQKHSKAGRNGRSCRRHRLASSTRYRGVLSAHTTRLLISFYNHAPPRGPLGFAFSPLALESISFIADARERSRTVPGGQWCTAEPVTAEDDRVDPPSLRLWHIVNPSLAACKWM